MRPHHLVALALTLAATTITTTSAAAGKSSSAIRLSKVKTLTFRAGRRTSHRRVPAVPQLRCVGGDASRWADGQVDVVRCRNVGSGYGDDDDDVQWTCEANLPEEFRLGATEVVCEGYDSPQDPWVLKGSCGLEYKLHLTELGEIKYGVQHENSWTDTIIGFAVVLFIFGVLGFMIYDSCTGGNRRGGPRGPPFNGPGGWGGGGGPDGDDNDPPPPYPGHGGRPHSKSGTSTSAAGQQPGFWTGTMAGAAAGYLAGRFNRNDNRYYDNNGPGWGYGNRWGGGGWGVGNGGYGGRQRYYDRASAGPSTTRTSTGFGGTSRR